MNLITELKQAARLMVLRQVINNLLKGVSSVKINKDGLLAGIMQLAQDPQFHKDVTTFIKKAKDLFEEAKAIYDEIDKTVLVNIQAAHNPGQDVPKSD